MANYDMEPSPGPGNAQEESKKVSFRFCRECSNMLYPLEDTMNQKLMFACRSCQYSEDAAATCIYRNSLKEEVAETAGNVQDVAQDPTVGNSQRFDDSAYDSAMIIEEREEEEEGDEDQEDEGIVSALCTLCGQEVTCPFCGQPSDGGIMLETTEPAPSNPQHEQEQIELEQRERALSGAGRAFS